MKMIIEPSNWIRINRQVHMIEEISNRSRRSEVDRYHHLIQESESGTVKG